MATVEKKLIVFCILMKMWKYYCTGSTLAAFTILLLVRLLYGQRRTLASWLRTLSTFYHLLRQPLEQVLHVVPRFGTGLAERKLVFISCMHWLVPNACPSSKDTTRLESRSILLPTMMQLTFWLMDLNLDVSTCSFNRTSGLHYRNFSGQWCRRRLWSRWRCGSSCWWSCETVTVQQYPTESSTKY